MYRYKKERKFLSYHRKQDYTNLKKNHNKFTDIIFFTITNVLLYYWIYHCKIDLKMYLCKNNVLMNLITIYYHKISCDML